MIQKVYAVGDDALQNLFDIAISPLPFFSDMESVVFRTQNVSIPSSGVSTYEVHYKTQSFEKPGGKIEITKELTIPIRVDRYWLIYQGIKNWKNAIANTYTGILGNDSAVENYRVPISVYPVDSNGLPTSTGWIFEGCFPKNIGDVGFDYTSGDPITVDIVFGFLNMNDQLI